MKDNSLNNSKMFFLESLVKNARSLLLLGNRNINVSNLQNYFRIQNPGILLGGCLTVKN